MDTSQFFPSYIFVTHFSVSHYTKKTQHPCTKTSNEFLCNLALTLLWICVNHFRHWLYLSIWKQIKNNSTSKTKKFWKLVLEQACFPLWPVS